MTDNNDVESGTVHLLNMRWYPICLLEYVACISAMESGRYGNLSRLMTTNVECSLHYGDTQNIIVCLSRAMARLDDTFKIFPGYENNVVPRSEYLFKLLQPQLEETLFLGQSYESLFDRLEIFIALVCADITDKKFAPIGRFAYKHIRGGESLYTKLMEEAESQKDDWPPIRAGLFNRSYDRFKEVASALLRFMSEVSWL